MIKSNLKLVVCLVVPTIKSDFLLPYVREDSTSNIDGSLPGRINKRGSNTKSLASEASFEKDINDNLKTWIDKKFNNACTNYGFNINEILAEAKLFVPRPYDYSS
eukprot:jgi/Orpsp1_1/1179287/evm.model.c7180000068768.1